MAFGLSLPAAPQQRKKRTVADRVTLGKTGIEVSYVGMGTGTVGYGRSSNQTRLGQKNFTRMVRAALDHGIFYFDCADWYGSHEFLRRALAGVPRDKYTVVSKIWFRRDKNVPQTLDRFRNELGVDYIDAVLLHCVIGEQWVTELRPLFEALSAAKEKGIIRAKGVSCHGMPALTAAAELDWADVVEVRINHAGANMDGPPAAVVPVVNKMHEAGKGVIGIKILGEGTIAAQREESLRFVGGLACIDAMAIGFERPEHVADIARLLERATS